MKLIFQKMGIFVWKTQEECYVNNLTNVGLGDVTSETSCVRGTSTTSSRFGIVVMVAVGILIINMAI